MGMSFLISNPSIDVLRVRLALAYQFVFGPFLSN